MQPKKVFETIGWIGTGVMGAPMCQHLMAAGHSLKIFTRTKDKAEELLSKGAQWANPSDIIKDCNPIFLMLGFPKDLENLLLHENGLLKTIGKGKILIDHTTSSPELAVNIAKICAKNGAFSIDAPVSGGDIGAKNGQLVIMAGGEEKAFKSVLPLLQTYGKNISYMGGPGKGQHTKMVNQIIIASTMIGVCEGLVYGYKAGLDTDKALELISGGAAGSFCLSVLGKRILERDFSPGFYVEHFVKDMGIALQEAEKMQLCLPGLSLVKQMYLGLMANGGGRKGTQALMLILEKLNNIKHKKQ